MTFPDTTFVNNQTVIYADWLNAVNDICATATTDTAGFHVNRFSGDGININFTLTHHAANEDYLFVYINGVYQQKNTYSYNNATQIVSFSVAPPIGTDNIEIVTASTFALDYSNASLVQYDPAGTGAVATNVQAKLRETVSVKDFGAVGDGVADDTQALSNFLNVCRTNKVKGFFNSGTYLISSALDISGVDIEGVLGGYNNVDGTIIKGSGGHVIFNQSSAATNNITYSIKNFAIQDGSVALKMTYAVNCRIDNIFITNCTDGIYCGDASLAGPLWCNFINCQVNVSDTALKINGAQWANANLFESCYFKGNVAGGSITAAGGIGAVSNQFINTEFAGDNRGVVLENNKSTTFDNCYFESRGPSIVVDGYTLDLQVNNCVFGSLRNNNADGVPAFIWHKSGSCRVSVNGGYIYLASGAVYDNLRFVQSDAIASFAIVMTDLPDQEIAASGWQIFAAGLPTSRDRLFYSADYTPTWTTNGTQPSLGNGTLTGRYTLSGRVCTVQFQLTAGSTTTFGTGQFQISLPFPAVGGQRAQGIAWILDDGTGYYVSVANVVSTSSLMVFYTTTSVTGVVAHNVPMTWTTNDIISGTITYEIAT